VDIKEYIEKAAEQPFGAEIYIPCEHRKQQMRLRTKVNNAADEYCQAIDPSIYLFVKKVFKDGRFWVVIKKLKKSQALFLKESEEAGVKKLETEDPEIIRMVKLMKKDGYSEEQIEDLIKLHKELGNDN